MSELPLSAPGVKPSVEAKISGGSQSLTHDQLADLFRVGGKTVGSGPNRLELLAGALALPIPATARGHTVA